jgi:hypothetical protein
MIHSVKPVPMMMASYSPSTFYSLEWINTKQLLSLTSEGLVAFWEPVKALLLFLLFKVGHSTNKRVIFIRITKYYPPELLIPKVSNWENCPKSCVATQPAKKE